MAGQPGIANRSIVRKGGRSIDDVKEGGARSVAALCALVSIAVTLGIVIVLVSQSAPFFKAVSPGEFFGSADWRPSQNHFGVLPLIVGTLMITIGAALFAAPMGLLTAIYLSEYASKRVRRVLKPALELLAGIPTVVYGYFGLFFVTPLLKQIPGFSSLQSSNALSGAIVVGIMILPLVASLCEDAIGAVPKALREGAFGLGSTKFEVILKVVLPAGLSGIVASFMLAISRALGETMAVTLAAGSNPALNFNPLQGIQTMTAYIVSTAKGDVAAGSLKNYSLYAVAITLFVVTLIMNLMAQRFVRRYRQVYS